ncbi:hypothetical protein K435DRAFT_439714 [Dendrothele bispora CBS 962.96]|uniref:Elongin-A n=1 Tax=Dendrothele bispora (strain CBS 962.96) TaxID=1314807 RepID=A0A4S8L319_DENBC|nr:hypothetical protein K435DRAFT_439714 [Dendrothele bispora CBS 962.96]
MSSDADPSGRRISSLVQYCQRVASNHIDSISSLGELPYSLVKPILERCTAEQLLRLEYNTPHLARDTEEIWRALCFRLYPTSVERYQDDVPESWRTEYTVLEEEEAQRLEAAANRLRTQRLQAEERKKEREVKFTDRVPPAKRARPWGAPPQPKTLFQKTRSEASKIQKNMYTARMIPPMPKAKDYRITKPPNVAFSSTGQSSALNRVTVNTVIQRRPSISTPSASSPPASTSSPLPSSSSSQLVSTASKSSQPQSQSMSPPLPKPGLPNRDETTRVVSPSKSDGLPLKPPSRIKKDPMASLFVPKHRAHSQLSR